MKQPLSYYTYSQKVTSEEEMKKTVIELYEQSYQQLNYSIWKKGRGGRWRRSVTEGKRRV